MEYSIQPAWSEAECGNGIGEIIRGGRREERLDVLEARVAEGAIDRAHDAWYRNLRRYGTVPHAGFGPDFEGTHRLRHQPCQHARCDPVHTNAGECEVLVRVQGAMSEAHRAI